MKGLRTRPAVLVLGLLGAGLALLALTATWARLGAGTAPGSELTGRQVAPAAFALALASLAGVAVLLLVGRAGRRVVGVLLALLGAGTVVAAWAGARGMSDGSALPASWSAGSGSVATSPVWAVVAAAGGLLVLAAGVLTTTFGGSWADASTRYSASGRPADTDLWRALDQGVDPTLDD